MIRPIPQCTRRAIRVPQRLCVSGSWWSLGFRVLGDSFGTRFR
jgi:hypothetical protein